MIMKISGETLSILKNFSRINPSILFTPGQRVRTISPAKTIMAEATLSETFDCRAGIYDLNRFIGQVSFMEDPDVIFGEDSATIRSGESVFTYFYAAEAMIVVPPEKNIVIPSVEAVVQLAAADLDRVSKAADLHSLPDITFVAEGGTVHLMTGDTKNASSNTFKTRIASDLDCQDFSMTIKKENLNLLSADYTVTLSSGGMAHFKSEKVQYWIATESK